MTVVSATALRKDIYQYLDTAVRHNDVVTVTTKRGNAVVLSEEDYLGLLATAQIESTPGLAERILQAAQEPIEEGVAAGDMVW